MNAVVGSYTTVVEERHPDETRRWSRPFVLLFRTRQVHTHVSTRFDEVRKALPIRVCQNGHNLS